MCCQAGESMMKTPQKKGRLVSNTAIVCFVGLILFLATSAPAATLPTTFDNQGTKIFSALQNTPELNLKAGSSGRTLMDFYALRQYPGSPPRIPHEVNLSFSGDQSDCLSCHGKGGYSPEMDRFAPVTPHPENTLCYQCHTQVTTKKLFVESDWKSIRPPRLGQSFLSNSPPPIPHSLQLRENCIACHTGPAAVTEIQIEHASRGDCRQCHAVALQTEALKIFKKTN